MGIWWDLCASREGPGPSILSPIIQSQADENWISVIPTFKTKSSTGTLPHQCIDAKQGTERQHSPINVLMKDWIPEAKDLSSGSWWYLRKSNGSDSTIIFIVHLSMIRLNDQTQPRAINKLLLKRLSSHIFVRFIIMWTRWIPLLSIARPLNS